MYTIFGVRSNITKIIAICAIFFFVGLEITFIGLRKRWVHSIIWCDNSSSYNDYKCHCTIKHFTHFWCRISYNNEEQTSKFLFIRGFENNLITIWKHFPVDLILLLDSSIYVYNGAKFEPDKSLESKYYEKTKDYKILCSIIEEGSNGSICEKNGEYQTLSKIIRNVYLEGPSGNRTLSSKPDLGGQIGVPQLVDGILGKILHNLISLIKDHLILL